MDVSNLKPLKDKDLKGLKLGDKIVRIEPWPHYAGIDIGTILTVTRELNGTGTINTSFIDNRGNLIDDMAIGASIENYARYPMSEGDKFIQELYGGER